MSIANPNDTVRFDGQLWRVETRIGGVYQLRAFRADGVGLTDEMRLARRDWFTVVASVNAQIGVAPRVDSPATGLPKAPHHMKRNMTARALDEYADGIRERVRCADTYRNGAIRAAIQDALRNGTNVDAAD